MTIIYILAAVLVFGVLIAVHELGHFLAAKACGVRVNEFSIGMGPEVWSREKGETQYSLRALPIGGFCAMEGEEDDSDDERALSRQGFWKQFIIFAAGAFMNFLTGFLLLALLYSSAQGFRIPAVAGVAPEFQTVNGTTLEEGDVFWSINGERVYLYSDVDLLLSLSRGQDLDLVVLRNGEKVTLNGLQWSTFTDMAGKDYQGYGIYRAADVVEKATVGSKLKNAWLNTIDYVRVVRLSLKMLVTGQASVEDVGGPVEIVHSMVEIGETSASTREAVTSILNFAALIAVNLAVMNLLPLPALDGGKIFFLVINAIGLALFKKQIPAKYENYIHFAGLVLLLALMAVITFSDVWKLVH